MYKVVKTVFSIGWLFLLFVFAIVICIGLYFCYEPLIINLQLLPYGSCRVKYKLFSKSILVDNIVIYKQRIYLPPISIPISKNRIPRIYIGTDTGYIIIKNLRPFAIKQSPIDVELKNFDLYKILSKPKLKNVKVTANASIVILNNNKIGLDVKNLNLLNTPAGNIEANFIYHNDNLDLSLTLPKYNHKLKCAGTVCVTKPLKWNLRLVSQNTATVKKLRIKNMTYTAHINYDIKWCHGFNNENLSVKVSSADTHITYIKNKNINLQTIKLDLLYRNNQISGSLEMPKLKHKVTCGGELNSSGFDFKITPVTPFCISNFNLTQNLFTNGIMNYNLRAKRINNINQFSGYVDIHNGNLQDKRNNRLINNICVNFKLDNKLLLIERLDASLSNFLQGNIQANGKLNINNQNLNLTVKIPNGVLHNVPMINANVILDANITRTINNPYINATINLIDPKIDATSIVKGTMTSTNMFNKLLNKTSLKKLGEFTLPIDANVKIKVSPETSISGAGLVSTWTCNGNLISKANSPVKWQMKLNAINGIYEFLNKKIELSNGEILLDSQLPGYYKLTLVGCKKIDSNNMVGIKFTQFNKNTTMDFFSNIMRSKQDILSLFLFDKEVSALSTSEAYSLGLLAQNIATGNENIISKVNKLLGIDTFEIKHKTSGTEESNTIVFGKKIGKWSLNFEQGKNFDETQLSVNRTIKKHAKVGVSLSKDNGVECGVRWSKRY